MGCTNSTQKSAREPPTLLPLPDSPYKAEPTSTPGADPAEAAPTSTPGADPAADLKQILKEIRDKFDEAGMGAVESLIDSLDDLVDELKSGLADLLVKAMEPVAAFKGKIDDAIANPGGAAPGGGAMAACGATHYADSVAKELGVVATDAESFAEKMAKLATDDVATPLKQVGDSLEAALGKMEKSVKALAKLPKLVETEIQGKDSPDDIATVNTGPMKKALEGGDGDVDEPLTTIAGLADELTKVVGIISRGVGDLQEFIGSEPGTITAAFKAPFPICCMSSATPQALTDLLAQVEQLSEIDLNPIIESLQTASDKIGAVKVDAVKKPMTTFQESAKDLVEKLDNAVKAANMASGGGTAGKISGFVN